MPRMFTSARASAVWSSEEEIPDERIAVAGSIPPHADVRRTVGAAMLVARHLGHPPSLPQGLDRQLLLDRRGVLAQIELLQNAGPEGPEAVLAVAQLTVEPSVDAGGDERAAGQAQELVEPAVQLARPAPPPRGGDVIRAPGEDRFDQQRNILRIVGSVGVQEHRDG